MLEHLATARALFIESPFRTRGHEISLTQWLAHPRPKTRIYEPDAGKNAYEVPPTEAENGVTLSRQAGN